MKTNLKKTVLSIVMAGTMAITCMLPATAESTAQAESNKIQYHNNLFTNKLYKKTAVIEFGNKKTKDKKTIKKVYKLLANMKLEKKEPDSEILIQCKLIPYFFTSQNNYCILNLSAQKQNI